MCGIVGISSHQSVAPELYDSLIHLQHRGQDAAGILTLAQQFYLHSGSGLVQELFSAAQLSSLMGNLGIGHTRYPTAGGYNQGDIQPLWLEGARTIALAHNGNLINYQQIVTELRQQHERYQPSSLDSEALLLMLADGLASPNSSAEEEQAFFALLCEAVKQIFNKAEGAYSVVSLVLGKGLIAFRDPHGIRPLAWGSRVNSDGNDDVIFASETTPFYALGFTPQGDILPGEVAFVSSQSKKMYRRVLAHKQFRPCVFEYVYFARPDATIDNINVYRARLRMGQNLGVQWRHQYPDLLPDVVIPAPFTANTAALSFAHALGVRYSEGLYKNPFIGRTFIMPNQTARKRNIRYKLTPQRTEIENKIVLIVDDSIVRGTTSREIVKMVREFGARKIYFVSTAPPLKNPCFYGIDIPSRDELIAAHKTDEEIARYMGVDVLLYQTPNDLVEAITCRGKHLIARPCMACMDGDYVCGQISADKMQQLEQLRNQARSKTVTPQEDANE